MKISGINGFINPILKPEETDKASGANFGSVLTEFIGSVNNDQVGSTKISNDFVLGNGDIELHEVMIAGEKAKTSLQLLMEIRNKTVDMYKELTRIPI